MSETEARGSNSGCGAGIHFCKGVPADDDDDEGRRPGYLVIGTLDNDVHAAAHGARVGEGEQAVWVPAEHIDALIRDRAVAAEAALTDRIVNRILRIANAQDKRERRRRAGRAFHAGLLLAAGEAKVERLFKQVEDLHEDHLGENAEDRDA